MRAKIQLHVAHKLFRLRIAARVWHQYGVIILLGHEEWVITSWVISREFRIIMSMQDCHRDVDILTRGRAGVHERLPLV